MTLKILYISKVIYLLENIQYFPNDCLVFETNKYSFK